MKNIFLPIFVVFATVSLNTFSSPEIVGETIVQVKFQNTQHAEHFMTWMSEQGEQDMHTWMEEAEPELAKMPTYDNEQFIVDYR